MNMREAWEAECKKFNLNPDYNKLWKEKFEAGYAAAIEAVKAGGVQGRGGVCFDGPLLYKLPEEMK